MRNVASLISIALIAVLLVISVFIISNTIKLTTFDRRDEIAIMKMVGATDGFIRWPFVYEGLLIGLMGAVIAFGLQWLLYEAISRALPGLIPCSCCGWCPSGKFGAGGRCVRSGRDPGGRGRQPDRHPEVPESIRRSAA